MKQQLMAWEFPLKSAGNATPSTCRLEEYWPETTLNTKCHRRFVVHSNNIHPG